MGRTKGIRLNLSVVVAVALAVPGLACGEDEAARPVTGSTALDVTVRPKGPGGPVERLQIRCPGHELCDRLARTQPDAFDPVPPTTACTQVYGGPSTARVEGRLRGTSIDASFSRANGCEISRWDRLAWLLGRQPGPGQRSPARPRVPAVSGAVHPSV